MIDRNSQFMAILTNVGAAKLANANALGIPWNLTALGVGDANGTDPIPGATQTKLINERRRAPLNQLRVDPVNSAVIIAEQVIPADIGGWWIREIGLYDSDGDLVAVSNCAPSFKPSLDQGSGRTQIVRMNFIVSSTNNIALKIDPAIVLATREYVDLAISEALDKQDFKHSVLVATTTNIVLSGIQTIDGELLAAGARVLVKDQTQARDNGIYVVSTSGVWKRAQDADASIEVTPGLFVSVEKGTKNGDSVWQLVTDAPIVLGTTALAFEMAVGRTGINAGAYANVTVDKYGRVIAGTNPTTLEGYGITDAFTKVQITELIAQASALAVVGSVRNGKMFISAASGSAGYVADELILKTALGGRAYRLFSLNKTINLAVTGLGGQDVAASIPANGFAAIYAIYNPTTDASGLLAVNATGAKVSETYGGNNMPAGYTASCLLTVIPVSNSLFVPLTVRDRTVRVSSAYVYTTSAIVSTVRVAASTVPFNAVSVSGTIEAGCAVAAQVGILISDGDVPGSGMQSNIKDVPAGGNSVSAFKDVGLTALKQFALTTSIAGSGTATYRVAVSEYKI